MNRGKKNLENEIEEGRAPSRGRMEVTVPVHAHQRGPVYMCTSEENPRFKLLVLVLGL
jgi:hypothetical protein